MSEPSLFEVDVPSICRKRGIRYTHRSFQDALYDLILGGTTVMNSRRLRHEMAMLLDFLHIEFKFTTLGQTGEMGYQVGKKMGGRKWTMAYIFDCVQKKKIAKRNILNVYPKIGCTHDISETEVMSTVDRLVQPGITFADFSDLSWSMSWVPCDMAEYHPYGYIRVTAVTRRLDLDAATPQVLLDLLTRFVVNTDTLYRKSVQRLRQATTPVEDEQSATCHSMAPTNYVRSL